jgi:hypothetical protein
MSVTEHPRWSPGRAPVAVVMISLNEAHNMKAVLENLAGWAQEVFLVDSLSRDDTVDIALRHGAHVVQRRFRGFGDQWNFALKELPITAPYTIKLDPDERLTDALKDGVVAAIARGGWDGLECRRRLWFMGRPLPIREPIVRVWKTGRCRFSDVSVNEHPIVEGAIASLDADIEHLDSPDLHHWFDKQNRYTTAEAISAFKGAQLAAKPRLLGGALERRMWLKRLFMRAPCRPLIMHLYCLCVLGAWRAGRVGFIWARLRADVYRMIALKELEMRRLGRAIEPPPVAHGAPHAGAVQADEVVMPARRPASHRRVS